MHGGQSSFWPIRSLAGVLDGKSALVFQLIWGVLSRAGSLLGKPLGKQNMEANANSYAPRCGSMPEEHIANLESKLEGGCELAQSQGVRDHQWGNAHHVIVPRHNIGTIRSLFPSFVRAGMTAGMVAGWVDLG